jgi:radical SAM protein with 4Fe4S-binding SPASM domain
MSPEEFERVLAAFPDVEKVELQGVGEVFLNDRVFELVRKATDRGITVQTFSNASLIDRATARKIVASGLSLINFSLDGADEPTFRTLRKGGTLKRFKRSVRNLQLAKAAAGATHPTVNLMVVLQRDNKAQVSRMLAIAEELGAETVIFTKINSGTRPGLEEKLLTEDDRRGFAALPEYRGKAKVVWAVTPWTKDERMACYWPQGMTYVTVEGNVTPCCNYFDENELNLGNVFRQSGPEVWNGEPYKAFRRRLWSGDLPSKCQTC